MAFKKTLAQRLFNAYKTTGFSISACRTSSSSMSARTLTPPRPDNKIAPDPGDNGIFRRLIHRQPMYPSTATSPELRSLPTGESLIEKLRQMDISRSRIKLDGLLPPQELRPEPEPEPEGKLTVADARKLLKISQLEMVKLKLKQIEKNCISYSEFLQICSGISSNSDQGIEFAKMLDDSGTVLVLGNVVFLRPDQVGFFHLFPFFLY
ncbi:hypothetical protein HAX54_037118 [Datura stramonium]|uniref:Calcium uniporter protein n=1 Tax=Datura stramonium TaxID=4076 RepID=A0ABS8VJ31_DATST|nr:hypothetical protein [Datura stramonium]